MFLQKYDFVVNYVPGKDLVCSNTLSRVPLREQGPEISETEGNCQVHSVISSSSISTERLKQLEVETLNDRALQRVASYITQGCPKSRNPLIPELKSYYNLRNELTVVNNLILKGNKIVIPSTLIKEMKQILHTGHLGIERTKSNARSTMYWPNINNDINGMISNCIACQKYRNLNPREPLLSHEIPKDVWNKVATDLFVCLNKLYMIVIDYTSKYFEIAQLPDTSSDTVITHMRSIFARHGIPKVVFSDNGPQYSSHEFKKFSKSWDFIHKTSSPEFPQSNRFVERAIQTIKQTLRKCREDDSDPYLTILALRTTKNSSGTSASELLMKRKLRVLVPLLNVNGNTKTKLKKPTFSQSRELQPFNTSDTVRYRQNNNWTRTGIIFNKSDMPRSYTLLNDKNNVIRRNRRHVIKMDPKFLKIENENMDNDIETEPKTKHDTSISEPGEVDEPRENATELRETSSYTTRSGRRVIRPSRYGE